MPAKRAARKVSLSDLELTDDEPPPVQRGRGANPVWEEIVSKLASTPGKWGHIKDVSSSTATNLKSRSKKGTLPPIEARMVDVDSETNRGTLWLRVTKK